ncbi:hypothetical protein ABEU20_000974 [Rhodococcus sp. PAM 2766]|uniref:Uncharacterized protein n=1 Tax=Rhodococcus parequi TaxID=3137122 RepID=A0ABW9FA54_9NOCA
MDVDKGDNERGAYDAAEDPDADPEMIQPNRLRPQPNQAEGADDPAETGEPAAEEQGE